MTKDELVEKMAVISEVSKEDVKRALKLVEGALPQLFEELEVGDTFKFCEVTFAKKHVEAKTARNPKTGDKVEVSAYDKITTKISSKVKKQ